MRVALGPKRWRGPAPSAIVQIVPATGHPAIGPESSVAPTAAPARTTPRSTSALAFFAPARLPLLFFYDSTRSTVS